MKPETSEKYSETSPIMTNKELLKQNLLRD